VHSFRFVNEAGDSTFVKFHWRPKLGLQSTVWDEAVKLQCADNDFHRRDMFEAIASGSHPAWEFAVQLFTQEQADEFPFDHLDPTKLVPEELVPLQVVGRMVLDRWPDNFFAETEQVAFCPGHIVPGIDFSNDPLLQGRLFSYTDTQISRLGGPNFHELPINRPVAPFHNGQRDAQHRTVIDKGRASYEPNSIDGGWPKETPPAAQDGGFESYPERIDANKIRQRSESFSDHFSQATLFFKSMSKHEQEHIIAAYSFELGKVEREHIRAREVNEILANIDLELAKRVAANLGLPAPTKGTVDTRKVSFDHSPSLSQANLLPENIKTRKVAILAANGVDGAAIDAMKKALAAEGAHAKLLGPTSAPVKTADGKMLPVDASMEGMPSVIFDAVFVPGGAASVKALSGDGVALHYVLEAYKHLKAIALQGDAKQLQDLLKLEADAGLLQGKDVPALTKPFFAAIGQHRVWDREPKAKAIPA
jgi:catalase